MWKSSKVIFSGLLVLMLLSVSMVGCSGQISTRVPSKKLDAFITDRVVDVRIVMKEGDWAFCQRNALAEQYVQADFWYDGELVPDVAIRPKGNSSLREAVSSGTSRFSFKVDFNLFNKARNFRGLKKLNFNNGFSDPTLIRECLAYELFEQIGISTPRASFVDLWINDTHLGVYTQVEQIDTTFLRRQFPNNANGNLYKPEMPAAFLNWTQKDLEEQQARLPDNPEDESANNQEINVGGGKLSEILRALEQEKSAVGEASVPEARNVPPPGMLPPGMPPPGMPPPPGVPPGLGRDYLEGVGLKTNENNPDHTALFHFLDILNNAPDETFPGEIEQVLDVDEALRFLAVSALIVHLDNYIGLGHNYYLYEIDGKFIIIPWDLNMAFGTFNCGIDREGLVNFYIDEPTCGPIAERLLVKRLLSYQPYLDAYHGYLESLLDGPFEVSRIESRIDELADLIRPSVESDELKFFSTMDFERCFTEDVKNARVEGRLGPAAPRPLGPPSAIGLKSFVVERSESVRQQLEGKKPSASGDGSGNGGRMRMFRR